MAVENASPNPFPARVDGQYGMAADREHQADVAEGPGMNGANGHTLDSLAGVGLLHLAQPAETAEPEPTKPGKPTRRFDIPDSFFVPDTVKLNCNLDLMIKNSARGLIRNKRRYENARRAG